MQFAPALESPAIASETHTRTFKSLTLHSTPAAALPFPLGKSQRMSESSQPLSAHSQVLSANSQTLSANSQTLSANSQELSAHS
ncbi:MAG: hypothetical protein QE267_02585 [Akkermansiaceae bacterium]|nr:hypothetical protein [Akkermansiaceae bacterium]